MENRTHFTRLTREDVGRYAIITENPADCEIIASFLEDAKTISYHREFKAMLGTKNRERITVLSYGIGSPSAAIAVEELASLGVDTVVRVGFATPIEPNAQPNDIVLATAAVKMDGTCADYVPMEFPAVANYVLNRTLEQAAAGQNPGITLKLGIVESKDAFYRPKEFDRTLITNEFILDRAWRKGKVLCSDMETAAIFVVSRCRWVRAASISRVTSTGEEDITPCARLAAEGLGQFIELDKTEPSGCLLT